MRAHLAATSCVALSMLCCAPRAESEASIGAGPSPGSSDTATTRDDDVPGGTEPGTSHGDSTGAAVTTGDAITSDADGGAETTGSAPEQPRWEQLIRADPFPRLVIEVDYVPGREPRPASIAELESVLTTVLDKPGGVEVVLDRELDTIGDDHAWTVEQRIALAIATSDLEVPADTIKIHALFVDGHAAEDERMDGVLLGVAWGHENIVMFRDTLDAGCQGAVVGALVEQLCAQAELLIWQHEVGHVLGLVDTGLPMVADHLDPTPGAGKHDIDHDCVMYREYEGLDAVDAVLDRLLGGAAPIELDAACLADIDAVK